MKFLCWIYISGYIWERDKFIAVSYVLLLSAAHMWIPSLHEP